MIEVFDVDVPRVELARMVLVQLKHVGAGSGCEHLAVVLFVEDRSEQTGVVPADAQQLVLEPAVGDRHFGRGASSGPGRPEVDRRVPARRHRDGDQLGPVVSVDLHELVAVARRRVEHDDARPIERGDPLGDCPLRGVDEIGRERLDPGVVAQAVLVRPVDARAGDDVVELVEQQHLPGLVERRGRIPAPVAARRRGRPQLGRAQRLLVAPVGALDGPVGGVRPPVVFEVELTHPDREVGRLGPHLLPERRNGVDLDSGHTVEVGEPARRLEHRARRSAAAVAVSERVQRVLRRRALRELALALRELAHTHVAVVGVGGREVREDARAVDALPPERAVREPVDLAPRHLLRQEGRDPGLLQDLRERGRVAEHVGQPEVGRLAPELVEEEALAVHDLANQRLTRRDVAVGLDPHAPDRLEPTGRHLVAHAVVQRRVELFHPGVLLGL